MSKTITPWGRQCKIQMAALDKTLEDISKETGYSRTYISSIINGRTIVPEDTKQKISTALEVDVVPNQ